MIQQMLAIVTVLAFLLGMRHWLRRRGVVHIRAGLSRRRSQRRLELLERLPLTPQHSLHVVRMGGRSLLIGVSPAGCALLETGEAETAGRESA